MMYMLVAVTAFVVVMLLVNSVTDSPAFQHQQQAESRQTSKTKYHGIEREPATAFSSGMKALRDYDYKRRNQQEPGREASQVCKPLR